MFISRKTTSCPIKMQRGYIIARIKQNVRKANQFSLNESEIEGKQWTFNRDTSQQDIIIFLNLCVA